MLLYGLGDGLHVGGVLLIGCAIGLGNGSHRLVELLPQFLLDGVGAAEVLQQVVEG